jgi:hypothetical protein
MNPNRPTDSTTLWVIGVAGGFALAIYLVMTGEVGTASEASTFSGGSGRIAFGAVAIATALAGGWTALRRKTRGPRNE